MGRTWHVCQYDANLVLMNSKPRTACQDDFLNIRTCEATETYIHCCWHMKQMKQNCIQLITKLTCEASKICVLINWSNFELTIVAITPYWHNGALTFSYDLWSNNLHIKYYFRFTDMWSYKHSWNQQDVSTVDGPRQTFHARGDYCFDFSNGRLKQ